jgi:RNA polymerase sigma-70 factor (ECF subfamily)
MAGRAVADGNLEGLVAVLDPDVVWMPDGGGRANAAHAAARPGAWAALSRKSVHEPIEIKLNGRSGWCSRATIARRSPSSSATVASRASTRSATRRSCDASARACVMTPDAVSARPRRRAQVWWRDLRG